MKKTYVAPIIEKFTFDYKVQTAASTCIESVINIKVGEDVCGEGTPTYIGWTLPETGV